MSNRAVFERARRPAYGFVRTKRDMGAIEDVGRFRFLTTAQLLQLHWPKPSQRRHGEGRLRELYHAGWLERQPLWVGLGRPHAVYSLGPLGRLHVAATRGVPVAALGPRPAKERTHDDLFLRHHLSTVQTVINLQQGAERIGGQLVHYREERQLRAEGAADGVIPDAFVVLAMGARTQGFCVELDRATVDRATWRRRAESYCNWFQTPRYGEALRSPAMLIVVDAPGKVGEARIKELKSVLEQVAEERHADPSAFWLTSLEAATPNAVLTVPIWLVGGREGAHRLYSGE